MRSRMFRSILTVAVLVLMGRSTAAEDLPNRVTILYDAFGKNPSLIKDWGFSAFVETGGKRILFDTGNNAVSFAKNVKALRINLNRLDFVVISHQHGDHTSGMNHVLQINPKVKVYAPKGTYGSFGSSLKGSFYRRSKSLPTYMRYFDGAPPETIEHGSPWKNATFTAIESPTEVAPGIILIPTTSKKPGTFDLRELTLAIRTPHGLAIVTGCSHSGIENILNEAATIDKHIHIIFGGLHLVTTADVEINRVGLALRDKWKVDKIAPGHCTGEPAFGGLQKLFGERYVYSGLGTVLDF